MPFRAMSAPGFPLRTCCAVFRAKRSVEHFMLGGGLAMSAVFPCGRLVSAKARAFVSFVEDTPASASYGLDIAVLPAPEVEPRG